MSIEQGSPLSPDEQRRKEEVVQFLDNGLAEGHDAVPVRAPFDWLRYTEAIAESAAAFPPDELVHDPAEIVEAAADALRRTEDGVIAARLLEHKRMLDSAEA